MSMSCFVIPQQVQTMLDRPVTEGCWRYVATAVNPNPSVSRCFEIRDYRGLCELIRQDVVVVGNPEFFASQLEIGKV